MHYWISTETATFGISADPVTLLVTNAAPIASRSIGNDVRSVLEYYAVRWNAEIWKIGKEGKEWVRLY